MFLRPYEHALKLVGTMEWEGLAANPAIMEMYRQVNHPGIDDDATPWCAAFVGACLERGGYPSTDSLLARSYENYGVDVGLDPANWREGDIGVKKRGNSTWQGHVFFLTGEYDDLYVFGLGGNQRDEVNVAPFKREELVAVRRVVGQPSQVQPPPPSPQAPGPMHGQDPLLRLGDRDPPQSENGPVRRLQKTLKAMHFSVGGVDGHFGRALEAAVLSMQAQNGLVRDGIVGPATWAKLREGRQNEVMLARMNVEITDKRFKDSQNMKNSQQVTGVGSGLSVASVFAFITHQLGMLKPFLAELTETLGPHGVTMLTGLGLIIGAFLMYKGHRGAWHYFTNWRSSEYMGR